MHRGSTPQQHLFPQRLHQRSALLRYRLLEALHLRPVCQLQVRPGVPLSEPHVRHVEEEGEEVEEAGEEVGAAHYTGDRLRVDGVGGEQEGRQGGGGRGQQETSYPQREARVEGVQQHVDQVEGRRSQSAGPVVESKREHAQGAVGAVRTARIEGCPPKVVAPHVRKGRCRQHVRVAKDGSAETVTRKCL